MRLESTAAAIVGFGIAALLARRCWQAWRWPDDPDDFEPKMFFAKRIRPARDGRPDPWR